MRNRKYVTTQGTLAEMLAVHRAEYEKEGLCVITTHHLGVPWRVEKIATIFGPVIELQARIGLFTITLSAMSSEREPGRTERWSHEITSRRRTGQVYADWRRAAEAAFEVAKQVNVWHEGQVEALLTPAKPQPKQVGFRKGDEVVCIRTTEYFTKGKLYTVTAGTSKPGKLIKVKDDIGYGILVTPDVFRKAD